MKLRDDFIKLLDQARSLQELVMACLAAHGMSVFDLPSSTTPDEKSRFQHSDSGDLLALVGDYLVRIEVKYHPRLDFESVEQLPKGYRGIIVDEAYKIDKAGVAPLLCYMTINKSKTGYLLVWNFTRKDWYTQDKRDGIEGTVKTFCFCPRGLVEFMFLHQQFCVPQQALDYLKEEK